MSGRWSAAVVTMLVGFTLAGCGDRVEVGDCKTAADGWQHCTAGKRAKAPKLTGELLDGGDAASIKTEHLVVVVNFWGSWCAPCRAEAADLERTYQATRASAFVAFVGINVRDDRDRAKAFEAGRVTYPSIYDPGSRTVLDFNIPPNATPSTVIIDRDGRIAAIKQGAVRQADLEPVIRAIATENPSGLVATATRVGEIRSTPTTVVLPDGRSVTVGAPTPGGTP